MRETIPIGDRACTSNCTKPSGPKNGAWYLHEDVGILLWGLGRPDLNAVLNGVLKTSCLATSCWALTS